MLGRKLALAAATLAIGGFLVACGGSDSGEDTGDDRTDARLAFSQCMRDNGVDMPDPKPDGRMAFDPDSGVDPQSPEFRAAQGECGSLMEDAIPDLDSDEMSERNDQILEFAQCMRGEGIDMADPQTDGLPMAMMNSGINPTDPAVRDAMEACQDTLPDRMGGGPGAAQ